MRFLPIVLTLIAAGCAKPGEPGPSTAESTAHKESVATVYVFRTYRLAAIDATITTTDRTVDRRLYTGDYFVQEFPPGELAMVVTTGTNDRSESIFQLASGRTYYIEIDVAFGQVGIRIIDERLGASWVRSRQLSPR